jgi:hypothetical protein
MVRHLLRRLPVPLLDEHAHLFFLALAVRLVGDESQKCRAAAGAAISVQLPRLSSEVFQQLLDYVMRWFGTAATAATTATNSDADSALLQAVDTSPEANKRRGLHKTAAVCAGLFVQARPDLLRRGDALPALLRALSAALPLEVSKLRAAAVDATATDGDNSSTAAAAGVTHPWECVYHAAVCLERVLAALPAACDTLLLQQSSVQPTSSSNIPSSTAAAAAAAAAESITALEGLCACLLYPHAWVRLACARAWGVYLSRRDPITLAPPGQRPVNKLTVGTAVGKAVKPGGEFLREKGGPFRLCKQTAAQLDRTGVDAQLLDQAVKNLVWVVRAMHANPELCYIAPAAATASASADGSSGERAVVVARSGRKAQSKQQNGTTTAATAASTNGCATANADGDSSDDSSDDSDGAESASDVDSDNEEGDTSVAGESPPTAVETAVGQEEPQQQRDPLVWIFHRMSFMGRAKGDARRRAVFKWFAAMGAALPVPVVTRFLPHMLTPLRRCALDAAANDIGGADEGDVVMTNTNNNSSAVTGEAAAGVAPVADLAAEVCINTYMIHLNCLLTEHSTCA